MEEPDVVAVLGRHFSHRVLPEKSRAPLGDDLPIAEPSSVGDLNVASIDDDVTGFRLLVTDLEEIVIDEIRDEGAVWICLIERLSNLDHRLRSDKIEGMHEAGVLVGWDRGRVGSRGKLDAVLVNVDQLRDPRYMLVPGQGGDLVQQAAKVRAYFRDIHRTGSATLLANATLSGRGRATRARGPLKRGVGQRRDSLQCLICPRQYRRRNRQL